MNFKGTKSTNDSMCNGDDPKAPANVNALRKLFENNFKLCDMTKPFKSKNYRSGQKSVNGSENIAFDVNTSRHRFPKSGDSKENRNEFGLTKAASPADCYLNCKIEHCCCKTFCGQYNEMPILRYRLLPKAPLQEHNGNSQFDRHCPERRSATSCSGYNLSKQQQQLCNPHLSQHSTNHHFPNHKPDSSRNKFYNVNYKFYKSKPQEIFNETTVSAVSAKRLVSQTDRSVNLLEGVENSDNVGEIRNVDSRRRCASHNENGSNTLPFHNTKASGFVNFTATALSEGGYAKSVENFQPAGKISGNRLRERAKVENAGLSKQKNKIEEEIGEQRTLLQNVDSEDQSINCDPAAEAHRIGSFGFKCRLPKLKNIGLRENSHPYSIKKPRLTVKGVKNRNMRNVKRRRKFPEGLALGRSQTFSGYDNFAYRCSIAELQSPKQLEEIDVSLDDSVNTTVDLVKPSVDGKFINGKNLGAVIRVPRPASNSVIGVDNGQQIHLDSRMTCYEWPVTSFYIERGEKPPSRAPKRFSSTFHIDAKQSCLEKNVNPVAMKTNLKRYRSLGYLEDEFFEYNLAKNHRSLENVNSKYD